MHGDALAAAAGRRPRESEVIIGTVDVRQLDSRVHWPIMRVLARRYVDHMALDGYVRDLLHTHEWSAVRVVPHPDAPHVFDVFGQRVPSLPESSYRTLM
jgi:hypothetical protein